MGNFSSATGLFYLLVFALYWLLLKCSGSSLETVTNRGQWETQTSVVSSTINLSPGFLSGALAYSGNQFCQKTGACKTLPIICSSNSTCCLSGNICGCLDPKTKVCKPIQSLRQDWTSSDKSTRVAVTSSYELAYVSNRDINCQTDAKVEIKTKDNGTVYLVISVQSCPKKFMSKNLIGIIESDSFYVIQSVAYDADQDFNRTLKKFLKQSALEFRLSPRAAQYLSKSLPNLYSDDNPNENEETSNHASKNKIDSGSNTVSMNSGFLSNSFNDYFGSFGNCPGQGSCSSSYTGSCPSTSASCCLISSSKNSSGCDCLPDGVKNCLVDHRVFKLNQVACTVTGDQVWRRASLRIPTRLLNNCIDGISSSWQSTSVRFEMSKNNKVEFIMEAKQCLLSTGVAGGYLENVETVRAEINFDNISRVFERLDVIENI